MLVLQLASDPNGIYRKGLERMFGSKMGIDTFPVERLTAGGCLSVINHLNKYDISVVAIPLQTHPCLMWFLLQALREKGGGFLVYPSGSANSYIGYEIVTLRDLLSLMRALDQDELPFFVDPAPISGEDAQDLTGKRVKVLPLASHDLSEFDARLVAARREGAIGRVVGKLSGADLWSVAHDDGSDAIYWSTELEVIDDEQTIHFGETLEHGGA